MTNSEFRKNDQLIIPNNQDVALVALGIGSWVFFRDSGLDIEY